MPETEVYAVQRVDAKSGRFDQGETVEAQGPLDAAAQVFGTPVSTTGSKGTLLGRVLGLNERFQTTAVMVYRAAEEPGDRASPLAPGAIKQLMTEPIMA